MVSPTSTGPRQVSDFVTRKGSPHAKTAIPCRIDEVMGTPNLRRPCTQSKTSEYDMALVINVRHCTVKSWNTQKIGTNEAPNISQVRVIYRWTSPKTETWNTMWRSHAITVNATTKLLLHAACIWMHVIDWCHKIPASQVYRKSEIKSNWKLVSRYRILCSGNCTELRVNKT